ncbi:MULTISPECIES: hypothetical protein [Methanobacterium]|jgi:hypothetical protein|uniref:Nucleic acid binding OB-fold tRNA/helicase-type n=1 Tax=Methanobacterium formicicum TaxID=2162 RepID=A0A090JXC2_METFO|nr:MULTISPECIES: hypothetical protein [Methanobacterium]AIS32008.1 hypothetical protein BRM9_1193 [Methanobacterium formicicum]AXV39117.1 MAG: hypothetical protein CIT02_01695 [Methanobacterium sp. BAmetb5]KUK73500.1 MAG: Uncharacterized protein XD90_1524 [Methanobacterium sp. 42_16]MBF4475901.1 hypothetical protein [Methanobacterium formicicum]MDD4811568.1 hypothetical protein [Methanobacterium formicicum]
MSQWKEVKRDEEEKEKTKFWEPEVIGETLQGTYIDLEENVGQFKSNLYTIRTSEGEVKVWGSTVLDGLMEKVDMGLEVRITFNGKQPSKSGKNPWKDFKLEYREK